LVVITTPILPRIIRKVRAAANIGSCVVVVGAAARGTAALRFETASSPAVASLTAASACSCCRRAGGQACGACDAGFVRCYAVKIMQCASVETRFIASHAPHAGDAIYRVSNPARPAPVAPRPSCGMGDAINRVSTINTVGNLGAVPHLLRTILRRFVFRVRRNTVSNLGAVPYLLRTILKSFIKPFLL
jgi:hypothetical protein